MCPQGICPTTCLDKFFPEFVADATAMERLFVASDLDWTIVRPPQLTDKPCTGTYRVREGQLARFGFHISRADVADCFQVEGRAGEAAPRDLG